MAFFGKEFWASPRPSKQVVLWSEVCFARYLLIPPHHVHALWQNLRGENWLLGRVYHMATWGRTENLLSTTPVIITFTAFLSLSVGFCTFVCCMFLHVLGRCNRLQWVQGYCTGEADGQSKWRGCFNGRPSLLKTCGRRWNLGARFVFEVR